MTGTPKLNLTDVPFVGDVEKPDDFGVAGQDSLVIIATEAEAIVSAKADYRKRQAAVEKAHGALMDFCRGLAVRIVNIRRQFVRQSDGHIDWRGQSNAYKRFVSLNIYEPMFGVRPEGVDRSKWNRESGYGSFKTTLDRAVTAYIDEQSAKSKLSELAPDDPEFIPTGVLKKDEDENAVESDSKALVRLARESKVVRKADGPDVQSLINTAETALRMMVAYGENDDLAPGLLKLTPAESQLFLVRLAKLGQYVETIGRVISAKLAASEAEAEAQTIANGDPDPATTEEEAVA